MDARNLVRSHRNPPQKPHASTLALIGACILVVLINIRWALRDNYLQIEELLLKRMILVALMGCAVALVLVRGRVEEALSTALLWIKSFRTHKLDLGNLLGLNSLKIFDNRFIELHRAGRVRIVSILSLSGHPTIPTNEESTGKTLYLYESLFNRLTDLFLALRVHGMQVIYVTSLLPFESNPWIIRQKIRSLEDELAKMSEARMVPKRQEIRLKIERLQENQLGHCYRGIVLVALWTDTDEAFIEQGRQKIENQTNSLTTSLDTVFPEMEVTPLKGVSLLKTISGFLFPQGSSQPTLPLQQERLPDLSPFLPSLRGGQQLAQDPS
ncbi:hypothetical protein ISS96_00455 [Candidatus Bathyarchaeota archaeon]|nr:hypothetical protein [Candidatus Bathyarchaeota archaeon]